MALDYLKVFPDIEDTISGYDDEQKGRLLLAMMRYAFRGEEPDFDGVERFVWPALRQKVDNCESKVEKLRANGSKGGRPRKQENQCKATETDKNQEKANESKNKPEKAKESPYEYDHEYEYEQEQEKEKKCACAREDSCAGVIALDGSDMTKDIERNVEAEQLIKRYGLPRDDYATLDTMLGCLEVHGHEKIVQALDLIKGYKLPMLGATLCALLEDFAAHGHEKVRKALEESAFSDRKGGISVKYYRAVLANLGKPRAAPSGPTGDPMLRMDKEERKASYSAAVVDLDAG